MKYLKNFGSVLGYVALYFLVQFIVGIVFTIVVAATGQLNVQDVNEFVDYLNKISNLISVICNILFVVIVWSIFLFRKKSFLQNCSFSRISLKSIVFCAIFGIALSIVINFATSWIDVDKYFPDYKTKIDILLGGNVLFVFISSCIGAPLFEEILCRGLIFRNFRNCLPLAISVVLQGVIFGFIHFNLFQGLYAAVIGIIFGIVLLKYNSIWSTITMHALVNFNSFVFSFIIGDKLDKFPSFNLIYYILGTVVFIIMCIVIFKDKSSNKFKRVNFKNENLINPIDY